MSKTNKRELISALIKDDLMNAKLISGLENLGIDAGLYHLGISDAIFVLMGIEDNKKSEKLFEYYIKLRQKTQSLNLRLPDKKANKVADEIYTKLIKKLNK